MWILVDSFNIVCMKCQSKFCEIIVCEYDEGEYRHDVDVSLFCNNCSNSEDID